MSFAITPRPNTQRSSLLVLVIAAHLAVALLLFTINTVVPVLQENPLFVDFLPMETPRPPDIKTQPAKPHINQAQPSPKLPNRIETTTSKEATDAPVVAPVESKVSPVSATAAEPAVSQPRFDADYLRNPSPAYPLISRRMGEEGKVILRVQVSIQGTAESVEIRHSSGSMRLDESAQKTVRTWKFIPAQKGDIAVQSWVLVPIVFKLEQ